MILHRYCKARAAFVEDISKVDERRSESHCVHGEDSKNVELDG